jgi:hypothetical protein
VLAIYLSGPISNGGTLSLEEQGVNVAKCHTYRNELWKAGFSVFCPHTNDGGSYEYLISHGMPKDEAYQKLLEFDLYVIESGLFDAMYMMPGWENSAGCRKEYKAALRLGLAVLTEMEEAKNYAKRRPLRRN